MTTTAAASPAKTINDLPDVILFEICAALSDVRARNSLSLVNRKFLALERSTRYSLTLRGNARDLFLVPSCFRSVTQLDLSLLSPWGHSLLLSSPSSDPHLLASLLAGNFPAVTSLTVYSRSPQTLAVLLPHWQRLSHEIVAITAACGNLTEFLVACMFDPSYIGFIEDETLLAIASNCPKLSVLHLVDTASLLTTRSVPEEDGYTAEDARVSVIGLIDFFARLPLLEELVLDVCKNVRNSCTALEALNSVQGMRTFACLLHRTLVEVKISACKNLDAVSSLRALEPVQDRIERLHIDCVWDGLQESGVEEKKKCKYSDSLCSSSYYSNGNGFCSRTWKKLKCLSLWIAIGELLTPLTSAGLEDCPNLEEIRIKIEGDCRARPKPAQRAFGLNILTQYPELWKMKLDCSDTIGYALTAPSGLMDLSLWERYFLNDIGSLSIVELDYWPPQDRDVNQRSLSLPAVGLLAESLSLRKLFIHGTAHEHFMRFLLKIPSLRDVQLREDYYPAPENDMSTEMRVDSCSRFEDALNGREIPD
ncbi:F-box protein MAX2 [Linum perenne]